MRRAFWRGWRAQLRAAASTCADATWQQHQCAAFLARCSSSLGIIGSSSSSSAGPQPGQQCGWWALAALPFALAPVVASAEGQQGREVGSSGGGAGVLAAQPVDVPAAKQQGSSMLGLETKRRIFFK